MSTRVREHRVVALGIVIALMVSEISGTAQTPRVRVIPERGGVPLETLLLPDDEIVVIERPTHGLRIGEEPTKQWMVQYVAMFSDIAVVMDVDRVQGVLTDDRSWIRTLLTGVVRDVLISRNTLQGYNEPAERLVDGTRMVRRVTSGERLEIDYQAGGELTINGVLVKAAPLKVQSGRRYLCFFRIDPETARLYTTHLPYLIENGKLISALEGVLPGGTIHDPLHGASLDDVASGLKTLESLP